MIRPIFILTLLIISFPLLAQESGRAFIIGLLEDMAQEQESELTEDDDLVNRLLEIYEAPIDVNTATREQMEELVFLSDFQIENLLAHLYVNGPLEQVYELSFIKGFSPEDIQRLLPFIRLEKPAAAVSKLKLGGNALLRLQTSLPKPEGYKPKSDGSGPAYLGKPFKLLQKSEMMVGKRWHAGYLLESDAGEPLFSHGIRAFDFMSGFLVFQPAKGIVSKVVIGDYSARFGQGLGVWTGFSMGLSSENTSLRKRPSGLTRYHSSGEASFLRGVGVELNKENHQLSLFGSYRPSDASLLIADTIGMAMVSTMRTTGLHRTRSEIDGRGAIDETLWGGYYQYSGQSFRAGIGGAAWSTSHRFAQADEMYRLFYFQGSGLSSLFADYRMFLPKAHLYGEIAFQDFGAPALMQGVDFRPGGGVDVTLAYRYFDRRYMAIFQNPYARSSSPGGEQGFYGAVRFQPFAQGTVTSSLNYYRYSWLRYRVSSPSTGFDYRLWARFSIDPTNNLVFRYRYSRQEQDQSSASSAVERRLADQRKQSGRVQWQNKSFDLVELQTIVEFSYFSESRANSSSGYWFSQDVTVHWPGLRLSLQARLAHFDTDDFYSRIYVYEPDVLYAFSVPARSGNGVLGLLNVGWKITPDLQCWGRVLFVHRRDAETIGSGYELVNSASETEVKLQLRYRF